MGMLNTTISSFGGQSVNLGFVTGDLKNLGEHLANGVTRTAMPDAKGPWDTHWRRARLLGGIWTSFLIGAVLGAVVASRFAVWSLIVPLGLLVIASRPATKA